MTHYTPTLEEFHIGFEYEILEDWDTYPECTWWPQVYGRDGSNPERLGFVDKNTLVDIRVKYLDEQDIKDLGFKTVWIEDGVQSFTKEETVISWWIDSTRVRINYTTGWQLFDGHVKNVNELKKLMSQIGIII